MELSPVFNNSKIVKENIRKLAEKLLREIFKLPLSEVTSMFYHSVFALKGNYIWSILCNYFTKKLSYVNSNWVTRSAQHFSFLAISITAKFW